MSPERQEKFFSGVVWLLIVLLLLGLAVAISYFKEEPSTTPATVTGDDHAVVRQPKDYTVFYKSGVFGPTNIRIHTGDKVIFRNFDTSSIRIVSEGYPQKPEIDDFDSKTDVQPNGQFSYVFSKEGIFSYYNLNNQDEGGTVIVRP